MHTENLSIVVWSLTRSKLLVVAWFNSSLTLLRKKMSSFQMGFGERIPPPQREGASQGYGVCMGVLLNGNVYTNHRPHTTYKPA